MTDTPESKQPPRAADQPKGFINPRVVNGIALSIITICILVGVTSSILAIWEYADRDTLLRTVGTVGVIILGTFLFTGVNKTFGD